jgi:hypothetical protein
MTPKLTILYLLSLLLGSCANNQRTPSKQRLESAADITLPTTLTVLKDEFQDMGQDYGIYYELKFDKTSTKQLTESIKSSRLYHPDGSSSMYADSLSKRKPNDYSLWYPITDGFEFKGKDGGVLYSITADTTKGTLNYHEYVL